MSQVFNVPWKAWYGDEQFPLSFPDNWKINYCPMKDAPELSEQQIQGAFENPIGTDKIRELAKGKKNVAIVLDDISRPTKGEQILDFVIEELNRGSIPSSRITIILALGAHRPMVKEDIIKKVGEKIYRTIDVINHYPYENLIDCGKSKIGTPIMINRYFHNADLKLSVSCIEPHEWAGFGGGAKNILPGISGIETLEANHRMVADNYQGMTGIIDRNPMRADIEEIARSIGLEATVNVVTTASRGIAGVFVGDMVLAHRAGVKFARKVFSSDLVYDQDILLMNAYPKDTEMLQISNAFNIAFLAEREMVKDDGYIIITTACPEGRGFHSLIGQGTRLQPKKDHFGNLFKGRTGIIFSPNLTKIDVYTYFPEYVHLFNEWRDVINFINKREKDQLSVAIYPTSPLQLPKE